MSVDARDVFRELSAIAAHEDTRAMDAIVASVRNVATPEGVAFYDQPMGAVIVPNAYLPIGRGSLSSVRKGDYFESGGSKYKATSDARKVSATEHEVSAIKEGGKDATPTTVRSSSGTTVAKYDLKPKGTKASLGKSEPGAKATLKTGGDGPWYESPDGKGFTSQPEYAKKDEKGRPVKSQGTQHVDRVKSAKISARGMTDEDLSKTKKALESKERRHLSDDERAAGEKIDAEIRRRAGKEDPRTKGEFEGLKQAERRKGKPEITERERTPGPGETREKASDDKDREQSTHDPAPKDMKLKELQENYLAAVDDGDNVLEKKLRAEFKRRQIPVPEKLKPFKSEEAPAAEIPDYLNNWTDSQLEAALRMKGTKNDKRIKAEIARRKKGGKRGDATASPEGKIKSWKADHDADFGKGASDTKKVENHPTDPSKIIVTYKDGHKTVYAETSEGSGVWQGRPSDPLSTGKTSVSAPERSDVTKLGDPAIAMEIQELRGRKSNTLAEKNRLVMLLQEQDSRKKPSATRDIENVDAGARLDMQAELADWRSEVRNSRSALPNENVDALEDAFTDLDSAIVGGRPGEMRDAFEGVHKAFGDAENATEDDDYAEELANMGEVARNHAFGMDELSMRTSSEAQANPDKIYVGPNDSAQDVMDRAPRYPEFGVDPWNDWRQISKMGDGSIIVISEAESGDGWEWRVDSENGRPLRDASGDGFQEGHAPNRDAAIDAAGESHARGEGEAPDRPTREVGDRRAEPGYVEASERAQRETGPVPPGAREGDEQPPGQYVATEPSEAPSHVFEGKKWKKLGAINKDVLQSNDPERFQPKVTLGDGVTPTAGMKVVDKNGRTGTIKETYQAFSAVKWDDGKSKVTNNKNLNQIGDGGGGGSAQAGTPATEKAAAPDVTPSASETRPPGVSGRSLDSRTKSGLSRDEAHAELARLQRRITVAHDDMEALPSSSSGRREASRLYNDAIQRRNDFAQMLESEGKGNWIPDATGSSRGPSRYGGGYQSYPQMTIRVNNQAQKILMEQELQGQISDGMWENSRPEGHWVQWSDAEVIVDPKHPGVNVRTEKDNYNLNSRALLDAVGDRMVDEVRTRGDMPDYDEKQMRRDLADLKKVFKTKRNPYSGMTKEQRNRQQGASTPAATSARQEAGDTSVNETNIELRAARSRLQQMLHERNTSPQDNLLDANISAERERIKRLEGAGKQIEGSPTVARDKLDADRVDVIASRVRDALDDPNKTTNETQPVRDALGKTLDDPTRENAEALRDALKEYTPIGGGGPGGKADSIEALNRLLAEKPQSADEAGNADAQIDRLVKGTVTDRNTAFDDMSLDQLRAMQRRLTDLANARPSGGDRFRALRRDVTRAIGQKIKGQQGKG